MKPSLALRATAPVADKVADLERRSRPGGAQPAGDAAGGGHQGGGGPGALLAAVDVGEVIIVAAQRFSTSSGRCWRDRFRIRVSTEQVEAYLDAIRHHAELVADPDEVRPVSRDPDDDYLIALARAERVDAPVSGDEDLTSLELAVGASRG